MMCFSWVAMNQPRPRTEQIKHARPIAISPMALQNQAKYKQLISKRELGQTLGISPRTVDSWLAQKRIPYLRLSTRLLRFNLQRVLDALSRYEIREVRR
jgi:hypothetical protein